MSTFKVPFPLLQTTFSAGEIVLSGFQLFLSLPESSFTTFSKTHFTTRRTAFNFSLRKG